MATILYRLSPSFEQGQKLRNIKEVSKKLDATSSELPEGLKSLNKSRLDMANSRDLTTEENLSKYVHDAQTLSNIYESTLEQAEKLSNKFLELRGELAGEKFSEKKMKELDELHKKFADNLVTTRNARYNFDAYSRVFDEAVGKQMAKISEREEDERNNVEHITSAPVGEGKKEEREVAPEMKAAESVLKAQQRSDLYKKRMETARENLRKQYEAGEFDAYEFGRAMAENGLVGGDR